MFALEVMNANFDLLKSISHQPYTWYCL